MITALYDGYCVICQSTRRVVKALDWLNRVEFLDLHDASAVQTRFPNMDYAAMMGEIHVMTPNGGVFPGFKGTRRMLRELPLGVPLWLLLQLPGMNWLGPKIYGWIARHRYAVNRFFGVQLPEDDGCVDGVCKIPQ
jgi:predicted DCC family thiol-disulfide oxidoreductase YuxK